jgi:hypothetical protein
MRQNSRAHTEQAKKIARLKYSERQIEKWIKWSISNRGYIKYNELVEIQKKYNVICYG